MARGRTPASQSEMSSSFGRRFWPARLSSTSPTTRISWTGDQVRSFAKRRQYRANGLPNGRNATLSVKTTQATIDRFYALAELKGWKAPETFEFGVAASRRGSQTQIRVDPLSAVREWGSKPNPTARRGRLHLNPTRCIQIPHLGRRNNFLGFSMHPDATSPGRVRFRWRNFVKMPPKEKGGSERSRRDSKSKDDLCI